MKAIPLTQGQFCFVDDCDFETASQYIWYSARTKIGFYAQTKFGDSVIQMQRYLLNLSEGQWADHENHDTLDNRRSNLRVATPSENARNRRCSTGAFKGVSWHARIKQWQAYVGSNPRHHIGYFNTAVQAAVAYDARAKEVFGKFACFNFPSAAPSFISDAERTNAILECKPRVVTHWRQKITADSPFKHQFHFFSYGGETMTIPQWAERTGINRRTLRGRIFVQGWTFEKAITTPVG